MRGRYIQVVHCIYARRCSGENVKRLLNIVKENEYTPRYVFDTHVHADHITGSYFLGKELGSGVERHIGRKVWWDRVGSSACLPLQVASVRVRCV